MRSVGMAAGCALALSVGGCVSTLDWMGGGGGPLQAVSANGRAAFTPGVLTGVYKPIDENSADVYLTDLPLDRLADTKDAMSDLSGTIVHVHLFLVPSAGDTPVDSTACNAAARMVVFSGGAVGVYSGGGFVFPTDVPGGETYDGRIRNATLRLGQATADFADKLGPTVLTGALSAKRDEGAAAVIAGRLASVANGLARR